MQFRFLPVVRESGAVIPQVEFQSPDTPVEAPGQPRCFRVILGDSAIPSRSCGIATVLIPALLTAVP